MTLEILTLPCLLDNYAYLLHDAETKTTALIDAPDAAPILSALHARKWALTKIFLTHHHDDHVNGVDELRVETGAKVFGANHDRHRLPKLDHDLKEDDIVCIGHTQGRVIEVWGHTIGHIAFVFDTARAAFTGDSLMAAGCGRLFEGSPAQMWDSLKKLSSLPPETSLYSGHEYTTANLRFAAQIEPENQAIIARQKRANAARARGLPTIPSLLSEEMETNPFLRAGLPTLKRGMGLDHASDIESFSYLRKAKDTFR